MFKFVPGYLPQNESHMRLIFVKRGKKMRFHDAARRARGEAFVQNFAFTSCNTFSSIVLSRHFILNARTKAQFFSNSNFRLFLTPKLIEKKRLETKKNFPSFFSSS